MKQNSPSLNRRLAGIAADRRFFWAVLTLLVLQAGWIALSGRYPMAFDEDFHLGIINLYAQHVSPFWAAQPAGSEVFGAISRDPSYLYHWLMSFPYRFISLLTDNQAAQVVFLRAINIGLFAWGLSLYRRLLLKTRISPALVNVSLLIFVLLPVVPLLAAQINYDNLLFPITAIALLLTYETVKIIRTNRLPVTKIVMLAIVCLLASLVKFPFLPIALALAVCVIWALIGGFDAHSFGRELGRGLRVMGWRRGLLLVAVLLLSCGLFMERYGLNTVRYHKVTPDCAQVLSEQACHAYPVWERNYQYKLAPPLDPDANVVTFTADWLYGMWFRTFFAVDGPSTQFATRGPLTLPGLGAVVFAGLGTLTVLAAASRLWARYDRAALALFGTVTVIYTAALWFENYQAFTELGRTAAINGRYLVLVYPMIIAVMVAAYAQLLADRPRLRLALAAAALFCLVWGGGALTYVLRSDDRWYWHSQAVYDANHAVQTIFRPVMPGMSHPTQYLP